MAKSLNLQTGSDGENLAASYLMDKGYTILHRNSRFGRVEVDLIAQTGNEIVFVEVKTRNSPLELPEKAVNRSKQKNLSLAAEDFLEKNPGKNELRFDIIAIIKRKGKVEVEHFEDAFYPFNTI